MDIYTIGFTKRSAEEFFMALKVNEIRRLLDIRLNRVSQLAGFAREKDLAYLLKEICDIDYVIEPILAPTKELLDGYRNKEVSWEDYVLIYEELLRQRHVENELRPEDFLVRTVLLCSEYDAEHCHRRLAAEYLQNSWENVSVHHL